MDVHVHTYETRTFQPALKQDMKQVCKRRRRSFLDARICMAHASTVKPSPPHETHQTNIPAIHDGVNRYASVVVY